MHYVHGGKEGNALHAFPLWCSKYYVLSVVLCNTILYNTISVDKYLQGIWRLVEAEDDMIVSLLWYLGRDYGILGK